MLSLQAAKPLRANLIQTTEVARKFGFQNLTGLTPAVQGHIMTVSNVWTLHPPLFKDSQALSSSQYKFSHALNLIGPLESSMLLVAVW